MNVRRALSAVVLVVVAALGLSACASKAGVVATVNGRNLTASQMASYLRPGAAPRVNGNGVTVYPRANVIQTWVQNEVFQSGLLAHGGPATTAELDAARAALLSGHQVSEVEQSVQAQGYAARFGDLALESESRLIVLVQRAVGGNVSAAQVLSAVSTGQIAQAQLAQLALSGRPQVSVSAQYGRWNDAQVALDATPGVGRPSFITLAPG